LNVVETSHETQCRRHIGVETTVQVQPATVSLMMRQECRADVLVLPPVIPRTRAAQSLDLCKCSVRSVYRSKGIIPQANYGGYYHRSRGILNVQVIAPL
jgi:hypothetical protein